MGKIFNALEKQKKEKAIKVEKLPVRELEPTPARDVIVQSSFNPKLVVSSAPESLDAESFKVLRTQILFPKNGNRPRAIMITSAFPGEGKTFVAANLGVSIAQSVNQYVLLLDCDFRRPNLHKLLGHSNRQGLHEYLTGEKGLQELIIRSKFKKLSLLTSGSPSRNPSELLLSTKMKEFLEMVKKQSHDHFIIIDAPPTQVTSEAAVLAHYVDGIIFVVMAQKSPRETIQKNIEDLGKSKIVGIVFNGYSQSYKSYDKYYKKYYK